MVVFISKNFTEVCPLFFPDKHFVVIAYSNIVEVHDIDHNVIWKIEEKHKIIKLEIVSDDQLQFFVALSNGELKLCNINTKAITDVMDLKCDLRNIFISNEDVLAVEHDCVNFYTKFDTTQKKQISRSVFKHISYSIKTSILAMVDDSTLSVMSINDDKSITHKLQRHHKPTSFTAVACHPTESVVATGDSVGKIEVWWDVFNPLKKTTIYHWHFLSLCSLAFTLDGTHLLSGGREQVVLKWELSITDGDRRKTLLPHLEADIRAVQPFYGPGIGEHYVVTLADNSYRIVNSAMRSIAAYSGVVQRSAALHEKIVRKCSLNPVGLHSGHDLPAKLASTIVLNGHEGKLQFFDLVTRTTRCQLDVACQNWPTETENDLVPGFIQIQAMATTTGGRCMATYEALGVATNAFDYQRSLRLFQWNDDADKFELDSVVPMDWTDKITDMVFHPTKADYLLVVTESLSLILFTRRVEHGVVSWVVSQIFELDEVLYRFKIKVEESLKSQYPKMVTVESSGRDSDGVLVVTQGDCLIMYSWADLLLFNTKPVFAVTMNSLAEDLDIGADAKTQLGGLITSSALFRNRATGSYRIVLGLQFGLIVAETCLNPDWSVELKLITSALSKFPVKSLASCAGNADTEARVAVLFDKCDHLTIFTVWTDEGSNSKNIAVPELESVVWVPMDGRSGGWTLVGLKTDHNVRSIVFCEDDAVEYFKPPPIVKKEVKVETKNLLSLAEDAEQPIAKSKPVKRNLLKRLNTDFLMYDAKSAPSTSMILPAMYSIK